jgi:Spy/CpxP family protein refolding chaperone
MQASTWKAVILLLLAALLGGAVGSAVTARTFGHRHEPGGGPGRNTEWYLDLLRRELDLTPGQQDSVREILRRGRGEMDSIWATLGPRMDQMRERIRADVRATLTPEQQAKFAQVTARLDARRREMMNRDSIKR